MGPLYLRLDFFRKGFVFCSVFTVVKIGTLIAVILTLSVFFCLNTTIHLFEAKLDANTVEPRYKDVPKD